MSGSQQLMAWLVVFQPVFALLVTFVVIAVGVIVVDDYRTDNKDKEVIDGKV